MEIVVASSNNGAVENVTTEIPGAEGIGTRWVAAAERVDYFTSTARLVHGEGACAMVAARPGNVANRRAFADSFWWGEPGRKDGCMADLLDRLGEQPGDRHAAKKSFLAAREKVKKLSAERMDVAVAFTRAPVLRQHAAGVIAVIASADAEVVSLQGALADAERRLRVAEQRHQDAAGVRDDRRWRTR